MPQYITYNLRFDPRDERSDFHEHEELSEAESRVQAAEALNGETYGVFTRSLINPGMLVPVGKPKQRPDWGTLERYEARR